MDLPLFPLHFVLFPGRPLPLHLFESRYRQMLRDCLDGDRRFGVVAIRAGREVGTRPDDVHRVGTVAQIETVSELPDGRYDIIVRGVQRFRILATMNDRPYLRATVETLPDGPCGPDDRAAAAYLGKVLVPYLSAFGVPAEVYHRLPDDPARLSYAAAAALQVEVGEHQRLLEIDNHRTRLLETSRIIRREAGFMRHLGQVSSFRPPGPIGAQLN